MVVILKMCRIDMEDEYQEMSYLIKANIIKTFALGNYSLIISNLVKV